MIISIKKFFHEHLSSTNDINKQHFVILALSGIPLLILFGAGDIIVSGQFWQAGFNLPFCLSLIVSLALLDKTEYLKILFRVNALLFGILLLYMFATGGESGSKMQWMHIYPLAVYFVLGRREGGIWNILVLLFFLVLFVNPADFPFIYSYSTGTIIRFLTTYMSISFFTHLFDFYRETYRNRLIARTEELQKALSEVKTLSGYLPVCASCKRVREKDGSWIGLEDYIRNHSNTEISHGLCDSCATSLYPTIMEEINK